MGYYMRFISADERDVSLAALEAALREADSAYAIDRDEPADDEGVLTHGGEVYGHVTLNRPGDGIFDEEIGELRERLERSAGAAGREVLEVLGRARAVVAVRVLDQGRQSGEETLRKLDPLWRWLLANRDGLLQADAEGYYDASGMILRVV